VFARSWRRIGHRAANSGANDIASMADPMALISGVTPRRIDEKT
jgi:hypothetical protein